MSAMDVRGLCLTRGNRLILNQIDFSVRPGEIIGLIGPNGSGKSTLLKCLTGILAADQGQILWNGQPLLTQSIFERSRFLTYVGSDCETEFPVTAIEVVRMGLHGDQSRNVQSVMEKVGCWAERDRWLTELSGGERQRVAIARALVQGSKLICLDESVSKLDLHHQVRMGRLFTELASEGTSFILVAHDLNYTTDWAHRCLFLKAGQVVGMDETAKMIDTGPLAQLYPDVRLAIAPHPISGKKKVFFLD